MHSISFRILVGVTLLLIIGQFVWCSLQNARNNENDFALIAPDTVGNEGSLVYGTLIASWRQIERIPAPPVDRDSLLSWFKIHQRELRLNASLIRSMAGYHWFSRERIESAIVHTNSDIDRYFVKIHQQILNLEVGQIRSLFELKNYSEATNQAISFLKYCSSLIRSDFGLGFSYGFAGMYKIVLKELETQANCINDPIVLGKIISNIEECRLKDSWFVDALRNECSQQSRTFVQKCAHLSPRTLFAYKGFSLQNTISSLQQLYSEVFKMVSVDTLCDSSAIYLPKMQELRNDVKRIDNARFPLLVAISSFFSNNNYYGKKAITEIGNMEALLKHRILQTKDMLSVEEERCFLLAACIIRNRAITARSLPSAEEFAAVFRDSPEIIEMHRTGKLNYKAEAGTLTLESKFCVLHRWNIKISPK